jgi:hypothetical protein
MQYQTQVAGIELHDGSDSRGGSVRLEAYDAMCTEGLDEIGDTLLCPLEADGEDSNPPCFMPLRLKYSATENSL